MSLLLYISLYDLTHVTWVASIGAAVCSVCVRASRSSAHFYHNVTSIKRCVTNRF